MPLKNSISRLTGKVIVGCLQAILRKKMYYVDGIMHVRNGMTSAIALSMTLESTRGWPVNEMEIGSERP